MVKYVKQSKKNLKVIIFSFNPFTEKELINLFLNYLQINLVCLMTAWCLFQNSQFMFIAQSLPYYERLFKKHNVSW